jgi:hypothetical protein
MHLEQTLRSKWSRLILAVVSIFYGLLWDLHWAGALVVGVIAFALLATGLPEIAQVSPRREKSLYLGSFGLAVLFCAMFPLRVLTDWDNFYRLATDLALSPHLVRIANIIENLSIAFLTFVLAFCVIFLLWRWSQKGGIYQAPARRTAESGSSSLYISLILYALPCLLVWSIFLYGFWPGSMFTDSYTQWKQFTYMALDDWHPVAHTLLQYLLTRIWNSPAIIAIFQVLSMTLAWSCAMVYFERKGIPRPVLFSITCAFSLLPHNGVQLITLVKDELFTIFTFVLAFLLGVIWVSKGGWLDRRGNQVLLGVFLALPFLFRHNGLLALLMTPLALLLFYRQRWKAILAASLIATVIIVGVRDVLAFGILKAKKNTDAVLYVVPIQHISAVGYRGGIYSPEEEAVLVQIAPIDVWQHAYNPYDADYIPKHWGVLLDAQIYDKIERNKTGLMRTFFDLFLKYPGVVIRSELDLMNPIWAIAFIEKEPAWFYKYSTHSWPPPDGFDTALFAQPNLASPIKAVLDWYLDASNQPATAPFFWRGGIYFFLTLALLVINLFTRGSSVLILFIPSLANILSLFLTMPMQNFRYLYPYVACVPLLFLFCMLRSQPQDK